MVLVVDKSFFLLFVYLYGVVQSFIEAIAHDFSLIVFWLHDSAATFLTSEHMWPVDELFWEHQVKVLQHFIRDDFLGPTFTTNIIDTTGFGVLVL